MYGACMDESDQNRSEALALAVRGLLRAFDRYRSAIARRFDVGLTEIVALGDLYVDGPLSIGELAGELTVTSGAATEIIDRLEKANVARRHPHPTDRRKRLVIITPEGERIATSYLADFTTRLSDGHSTLTPIQHDGVDHFLAAVTARLTSLGSLKGAG